VLSFWFMSSSVVGPRDGFRERGALGHLSFGAPSRCDLSGCLSEKCERMPLLCVAPPQTSLLLCQLWFYICLKCSTEIKAFPTFFKNKRHCDLFLEFIALSCNSEVLFVKFPWVLAFFVGLFIGCIHFHVGPCCCPWKYRLAVNLMTCM